ncbi:hypothetical protein PCK2_000808, partial [Pneumocystis canis]
LTTKNISKLILIKNLTSLKPSGTITVNMNYIYHHAKPSKIMITRISDNELLLSYYLKAIFISSDGHLLERQPIIWDSVPTHMVYFHPHLITAFTHCIKVHNIESYILIQTFNIKNTTNSIYSEQFKGPSETIDYLKKLGDNNIEEILSFIKWPLEIDPNYAMEVFLNDNQQISSSKQEVYNFLLSFNEDLAVQYLEYLINCLDDATPEFHNSLIMHYLKIIKEKNSSYISENLLKLLISSEKYNFQYIFEHLPKNDKFLEHKAIILSKLGQHKYALEIYIFEIKDFKKATEYCERVSSMENSKLGNKIYLILLDVLLNSQNDQNVQLSYILNLLSQYRSQINIETIMSNLPLNMKISDLKLYLEGTIQDRITEITRGKITSSLQIANLMQYQNKLIDICSKKYIITPEKTCQNCHKRLGQSVLAIFPKYFLINNFLN